MTENLTACLIKLAVLAITLFISVLCALPLRNIEGFAYTSFYITTLVQAINTLYEDLSFLVISGKQLHKYLLIALVIIVLGQILLIMISVGSLIIHASPFDSDICVNVAMILVTLPIFLLGCEIFVHVKNYTE